MGMKLRPEPDPYPILVRLNSQPKPDQNLQMS